MPRDEAAVAALGVPTDRGQVWEQQQALEQASDEANDREGRPPRSRAIGGRPPGGAK